MEKQEKKWLRDFFKCMRFTSIWPPIKHDRFYNLKVYINITIMAYYITGLVLYIFKVAQDQNSEMIDHADAVFTCLCISNLFFNYVAGFYLRDVSHKLFNTLITFDNFGLPDDIEVVNKRVELYNKLLFGYCYSAGNIITIAPLFFVKECEERNRAKGKSILCGFGTIPYYPYNIQTGFSYYLHLVLEIYSLAFLTSGGVLFSSGSYAAIEFINIRLDHLMSMLRKIFDTEDSEERKQRLKRCVVYHIYIVELVDVANKSYQLVTSPALFNYSVIIGVSLLTFMIEHTTKAFLNAWGWLFAVFAICLCGDNLQYKSMQISQVIYETKWYEADLLLRKDLIYMMMRAQKSLILKAGPFGHFSFEAYKKILTGAYTYLSMRSNLRN